MRSTRRRALLAATLAAIALLGLAGPARATSWHVVDLTDAATGQGVNPAVVGRHVAWRGFWGIWLHDTASSGSLRLAPDTPNNGSPVAAGNLVAWASGGAAVRLYDTGAGTLTSVDTAGNTGDVATDGATVVWADDSDGDAEVFAHRIATGATTKLSENEQSDRHPVVDGRHVAWVVDGGDTIRVHDLESGVTTDVTQGPKNYAPSVSAGRIAWLTETASSLEVRVHDLATGVTTPLTQDQQFDWYPIIRGQRVAWMSYPPITDFFEPEKALVQVHDLATGERHVVGPFIPYLRDTTQPEFGFDGETVAFRGTFEELRLECTDLLDCLSKAEEFQARIAAAMRVQAYHVGSRTIEEVGGAGDVTLGRPSVDGARVAWHGQPAGWTVHLATRDGDDDGALDPDDVCPEVADPDQSDADEDGVGDACDVCPDVPDPDQADGDANGVGDACECTAANTPALQVVFPWVVRAGGLVLLLGENFDSELQVDFGGRIVPVLGALDWAALARVPADLEPGLVEVGVLSSAGCPGEGSFPLYVRPPRSRP